MPLYEYLCDACGHRFELIRKFSDPPAETCPKCGGRVQKVVSAPAFQLKGTGWYATDYAKKDSGSASAKDDKPAAAADKDTKTADGGNKTDKPSTEKTAPAATSSSGETKS